MRTTRPDFDYANARVRARKAALLDAAGYGALIAADVDGMLAALADTPYRPDLEAATSRFSGLQLLYEAVRTSLARHLRDLARWYEGDRGVELVLGRWDLRNVRTILRGQFSRTPPDEMRAAVVPAGNIDPPLLESLVSQTSLRQTIEAMVVWAIPSPAAASAVLEAWPAHERTGDLGPLERALERAAGARIAAELDEIDPSPAAALRAETNMVNLLTAVRVMAAGGAPDDGVSLAERLRPGGTLPVSILDAVARAEDRDTAREALAGAALPPAWASAVDRWTETADAVALSGDLEEAVTRAAYRGFTASDPLGAGIPTAFVWAKENEARNLRSIGSGIAAGVPGDTVEQRLVIL